MLAVPKNQLASTDGNPPYEIRLVGNLHEVEIAVN
jgi:hypothetical protein